MIQLFMMHVSDRKTSVSKFMSVMRTTLATCYSQPQIIHTLETVIEQETISDMHTSEMGVLQQKVCDQTHLRVSDKNN
jgi:hypothetical protein